MKRSSAAPETPKRRLTLKSVNQALAAAGAKEKLVRGHGHHFFVEGGAARWSCSRVMKPRLSDYTLQDWVTVWRNMRDDYYRMLDYSFTGQFR